MKLTLKKIDDDWFIIERAEHDGREWWEKEVGGRSFHCSSRFSYNADIEGYGAQMLAIAQAIVERKSVSFKRCAVRIAGEQAFFCSPRNSKEWGRTTLVEADELAKTIFAQLEAS